MVRKQQSCIDPKSKHEVARSLDGLLNLTKRESGLCRGKSRKITEIVFL